jgi:hypothetical protein
MSEPSPQPEDRLPANVPKAGALAERIHEYYVDFAVQFHTAAEQRRFTRMFRFEFTRCAMRNEPAGVVWFGFRAWAVDEQDALTQAVLAVRYVTVRTKLKYRPVAQEAKVRDLGPVNVWDVERAHNERSELVAKLNDPTPHLIDPRHKGIGGAPEPGAPGGALPRPDARDKPSAAPPDDDEPPPAT